MPLHQQSRNSIAQIAHTLPCQFGQMKSQWHLQSQQVPVWISRFRTEFDHHSKHLVCQQAVQADQGQAQVQNTKLCTLHGLPATGAEVDRDLCDCRCECGFAVVDVTNSSDVQVLLCTSVDVVSRSSKSSSETGRDEAILALHSEPENIAALLTLR